MCGTSNIIFCDICCFSLASFFYTINSFYHQRVIDSCVCDKFTEFYTTFFAVWFKTDLECQNAVFTMRHTTHNIALHGVTDKPSYLTHGIHQLLPANKFPRLPSRTRRYQTFISYTLSLSINLHNYPNIYFSILFLLL